MSCVMAGCRERAEFVVRGVAVKLPGHPENVNVGDINVCPTHRRDAVQGRRVSIRDDVVTAALARRH